ncbi:hypothetical protein CAL29_02540 [Bordetella genomosp. 10]|uniref:Uncharacterized protein n=1 Tax=Bordetella genomosp. 10 TaxID=1416804 RepID=A0A261SIQ7_9BORD|nr:hypothetical protein [Bordetella genomosp. 10]OZI37318.1 hypothetical protein CAL29_02540 [Bordetella genomosp. 10]
MDFLERMGLPGWIAWFGPVALLLIASFAWNIYNIKRQIDRRAAVVQKEEAVRASGDAATATVLETADTGVRTGADEYFIWRLRLAVRPALGQPFERTIEVPVAPTRFADFAEGKEIRVRVAADRGQVVVDQRTK